jgi:hypothetical protein
VLSTSRRDGTINVVLTAPGGSIQTTLVVSESQEVLRALERNARAERATSLEVVPLELPPDRAAQFRGLLDTDREEVRIRIDPTRVATWDYADRMAHSSEREDPARRDWCSALRCAPREGPGGRL